MRLCTAQRTPRVSRRYSIRGSWGMCVRRRLVGAALFVVELRHQAPRAPGLAQSEAATTADPDALVSVEPCRHAVADAPPRPPEPGARRKRCGLRARPARHPAPGVADRAPTERVRARPL